MKHIEQLWEGYKKTIPSMAPPMQIVEAKLGFYSGCTAMFSLLMDSAQDGTVTHAQGVELLQGLRHEVDEFLQELLDAKP